MQKLDFILRYNKDMDKKLKLLNSPSKAFVVATTILVIIFVVSYTFNVLDALSMDKNSYNCTSDSMMMQICHHPYSSSITWAIFATLLFGSPVIVIWIISGLTLLFKRYFVSSK